MMFKMTTEFEKDSLKTKDCRALTRQSQNFVKKWPPGGSFQVRTPNFELERAFMLLNMTTKF